MAFYDKVYKLEKEENYKEFVDAFGLPEEKASFLLNYKPNQKFLKDGDSYTHVLYFGDIEIPVQFKVGEEFENTMKTTKVKNLYTIEGSTVTQVLKFDFEGKPVTTVKKEFAGDKMTETITSNLHGVVAKRYFSV